MITLYHCAAARSFRPLWMLEELGLPYELKMLPFPPRVFAKEYLAINPLGTIPFMIDGDTKMTESSGICHYLGTRHGPTPLIVGEAAWALALSEALMNAGFWVAAIRPPTVPAGSARLRVTLSAAHREQDVDALAETLGQLWHERSAA